MVFIVVFLNEGPLEKQHLLKGYPSQIYQIKSNQDVKKIKNCDVNKAKGQQTPLHSQTHF